jgi:DNA (cytosine-5)-methyltransferase 1
MSNFFLCREKMGLTDTRGTLFNHYTKILEQVNPKIFLVENVKGLTTHDHGVS